MISVVVIHTSVNSLIFLGITSAMNTKEYFYWGQMEKLEKAGHFIDRLGSNAIVKLRMQTSASLHSTNRSTVCILNYIVRVRGNDSVK